MRLKGLLDKGLAETAPLWPAVRVAFAWVHQAAHLALDHARSGQGPVFLLANTYRLTGHYVGDPQVYRPKDEVKRLRETQDPINKLREQIGYAQDEWEELEREVHELVEGTVEFSKNGTDPKPEDALKNVYA